MTFRQDRQGRSLDPRPELGVNTARTRSVAACQYRTRYPNLSRLLVLGLVALGLALPQRVHAKRPPWHVAFVVDQSGSMDGHDPDRNAIVAPAILADLTQPGDSVVVFTQDSGTSTRAIAYDPAAPSTFRKELLSLPNGSSFRGALTGAFEEANKHVHTGGRTALMMVYDGDDPGDLSPPIAQQLTSLQAAGGAGFVFGMGSKTTGRPAMKAFGPHALTVNSGRELLQAYATAFKVLLGTRKTPQTGRDRTDSIHVVMPKGAQSAWFVALADHTVSGLHVLKSPGGKARASVPPGSGWNFRRSGVLGSRRGYRVLRIDDPAGGDWFFKVDTAAAKVDWLLLPVFDLELSATLAIRGRPRVGQQVPVAVKLKGKVPKNTEVTVEQGGARTMLTCQGQTCHGFIIFDHPGKERLKIRARSEDLEVDEVLEVDVDERIAGLLCDNFKGGPAAVGTKLVVVVQTTSSSVQPRVARLELSDGRTVTLRNDGKAQDRIASDRQWTAGVDLDKPGPLRVKATMRTSEGETECIADFEVLHCVDPVLALPQGPISWGPCDEAKPDAGCQACAGGCAGTEVQVDLSGSRSSGLLTAQLRLAERLPRGVTAWVGSEAIHDTSGPDVKLGPGAPPLTVRLCSSECPGSGLGAQLSLILAVDRVFSCVRPEKTGTQSASDQVDLDARNVGWLYCWRYEIVVALISALVLFLIWGFVRPMRFPAAKRRAQSWPRLWETSDVEQLPMSDYLSPTQTTRKHAHGGIWWTDQRMHFNAKRSACGPEQAVLTVEFLRQEPPEVDDNGQLKGPGTKHKVCWIRAHGTHLIRSTATYSGQGLFELRDCGLVEVKERGEQLQLGAMYLVGGDPDYAIIFS